jgi:hypothetical protein
MYCSLHRKNRSLHFLEPIMGTDQYRCIPGNECQIGSGSNSNQQTQYTPVDAENYPSPNNYDRQDHRSPKPQSSNPQVGSVEKFMCNEHNKLRIVTMLDQYFDNDGSTAYKCKAGEECKTLGKIGSPSRRPNNNNGNYNGNNNANYNGNYNGNNNGNNNGNETLTPRSNHSPYSSQGNRGPHNQQHKQQPQQQQQEPPFKPGMRPQSYDSFPLQQNQNWPTNHHDPYGQSYRPPYNNYPPHFYSTPSGSGGNQSGDSRPRQTCDLHGKLRTVQNLVEMPNGKWECTSADPCRQSANETAGKDQGQ